MQIRENSEEEQWVNTFTGEIYFGDTPPGNDTQKNEDGIIHLGKDNRTNEELEAMEQKYQVKEEDPVTVENAFFQELKENLENSQKEGRKKGREAGKNFGARVAF